LGAIADPCTGVANRGREAGGAGSLAFGAEPELQVLFDVFLEVLVASRRVTSLMVFGLQIGKGMVNW